MTVILTEPFTGSNGDAWSASWASSAGTAGTSATIQSNRGRLHTGTATGYSGKKSMRYTSTLAAVEVTGTFQYLDSGIDGTLEVWLRGGSSTDDGGTGYFFTMPRSGTVEIYKAVSFSYTSLGTYSFSISSTTDYKFRFQAVSTGIKARIWLASSGEPGTWDISVTDSSITGAGYVHLHAGGGNTANCRMDLEDVEINDGSTAVHATVTPGVITAVAAVPSPALATGSTVAPGVITAVASVPAAAVDTATHATPTPGVIAAVASVPSPSLSTSVVVTPAVIAATTSVPVPGIDSDEPEPVTVAYATRRSYVMRLRVESWLGDTLLSDDVPVAAGTLEYDRTLAVPDRLTLTVPRVADGVSWDPSASATHPLAPYGQQLRVIVGEDTAGVTTWTQKGWFLIRSTKPDGDNITVEAAGLLALIEEARFVTPFQPTGTFKSTIRQLCEPAVNVLFDSGLPSDRAIPAGMAWDEDRLGALEEVLDGWPAHGYVNEDGVLFVTPTADASVPTLDLTDGEGGTVVQWAGAADREGAANVVVARGQDSAGNQLQGTAYDTDTASPMRWGGPFNAQPVPFFYFSPLLTTVALCRASAVSIRDRRRRETDRRLSAHAVPDASVRLGDRATYSTDTESGEAIVEAFSLPLTADGGAMGLSIRVTS